WQWPGRMQRRLTWENTCPELACSHPVGAQGRGSGARDRERPDKAAPRRPVTEKPSRSEREDAGRDCGRQEEFVAEAGRAAETTMARTTISLDSPCVQSDNTVLEFPKETNRRE